MNSPQTTTAPACRCHEPRLWSDKARSCVESVVVIVCGLIFTAFVLDIGLLLLTGNNPHHRDILTFWTAGRQMLHHGNPYDIVTTLEIERSVGFIDKSNSFIMRNPPTALALVMPLGLIGLRAATLLWSLLLLAALALSIQMLGPMLGRSHDKLHYVGYGFGPALMCLMVGQSALFALLGLVLFLRFCETRPFVAGLALWFCAVKPHLFLPFAAILLLWIFVERRYRVLAGTALSLAASSAVAWAYDPAIWTQYRQLMHSSDLQQEFIPCPAIALRFAIHPQAMWIQSIPAALGLVWAIYYYWSRRDRWDWMQNGALVMLVGLLVSPYSWVTDQCLLIPAMLVGLSRATTRVQLGVLMVANAALEIANKGLHSKLYLWMAPLWLAWFLYVSAKSNGADSGVVDARQETA